MNDFIVCISDDEEVEFARRYPDGQLSPNYLVDMWHFFMTTPVEDYMEALNLDWKPLPEAHSTSYKVNSRD